MFTLDFIPNEAGSFEDKYSIILSDPPNGESIPKGLVGLVILVIPGADESIVVNESILSRFSLLNAEFSDLKST